MHKFLHRFIMVFAILLTITLAILAISGESSHAEGHYAGQSHWHINREASWYGPGFEGKRTACGRTMRAKTSWHVAALKTDLARCGLKVRICKKGTGRCVNVTVQDSGSHRSKRRDWDLTPRVKQALRCPGLCDVNWKKGW